MATLSNEVTNKFEREMVYAYALKPELLKTYPCDKKFFKNTLYRKCFNELLKTNGKVNYEMITSDDEEVNEFYKTVKDNLKDFNKNYENFLKINYLRQVGKSGFNISPFYDEVDDTLNTFYNTSLQEMKEYYKQEAIKSTNFSYGSAQIKVHTYYNMPKVEKRKPIIDNMLVERSVCNLVGGSKKGKSFFGYQMAFDVANGKEFFGHKTHQCDVVYVDWEMDSDDIDDRLHAIKDTLYPNDDNMISPYFMFLTLKENKIDGLAPDLTQVLSQVRFMWEQNKNIKLLMLDCFYRFYDEDENDVTKVRPLLIQMKQFEEETGITIIYVHHVRKELERTCKEDADVMGAPRGSSVHGNFVDQTILIMADISDSGNFNKGIVKWMGRKFFGMNYFKRRNNGLLYASGKGFINGIRVDIETKEEVENNKIYQELKDYYLPKIEELIKFDRDGRKLREEIKNDKRINDFSDFMRFMGYAFTGKAENGHKGQRFYRI